MKSVKILTSRSISDNNNFELKIEDMATVLDVINALPDNIKKVILNDDGKIKPEVLIFLDDVEVTTTNSLNDKIEDGAILKIIHMVHGG